MTQEGALFCPECWSEAAFITGTICETCGRPQLGEFFEAGMQCDACHSNPPYWDNARSAMIYEGSGRRAILALKHGDRLDLAKPLADWMIRAGAVLVENADIIAPVPLHRMRMLKRKYNQSAELARYVSKNSKAAYVPDLIIRHKSTKQQNGMTAKERQENQSGAFKINPRYANNIIGKKVLLIDDVLTTGATLGECSRVLREANTKQIDVLVLACVANGNETHIYSI